MKYKIEVSDFSFDNKYSQEILFDISIDIAIEDRSLFKRICTTTFKNDSSSFFSENEALRVSIFSTYNELSFINPVLKEQFSTDYIILKKDFEKIYIEFISNVLIVYSFTTVNKNLLIK